MISHLISWEKVDKKQRWLFAQGNSVVVQRTAFPTSQETLFLGAVLLAIPGSILLTPYLFEGVPLVWESLIRPESLIPAACALFGAWMVLQSKKGITLRKESGGIHPKDTLFIFDGTRQAFFTQTFQEETMVAPFSELEWSIHRVQKKGNNHYELRVRAQTQRHALARFRTHAAATALLEDIKTRMQFPQLPETADNKTHTEKLLQNIKTHLNGT